VCGTAREPLITSLRDFMVDLTGAVDGINLSKQEQFVRHLVANVGPLLLLAVIDHHVFAVDVGKDSVTGNEIFVRVHCCGITYRERPVTERAFEWLPYTGI
jgi:hypothetical protein